MNRTYKVIWSKARRCYVVVSELAKGQHKSSNKNEQISSNVHRGDLDDSAYGDHGSFQNWGSSIGAEYGRKKTLRNGWSLEPQAQLTYNYLWGDDYTTRNGARVHQDNADSLVGRLGPVLGREFHENAKNSSRVYLKASVLHDFLGDTTSRISDDLTYTDTDDLGDTWYVVGIPGMSSVLEQISNLPIILNSTLMQKRASVLMST